MHSTRTSHQIHRNLGLGRDSFDGLLADACRVGPTPARSREPVSAFPPTTWYHGTVIGLPVGGCTVDTQETVAR